MTSRTFGLGGAGISLQGGGLGQDADQRGAGLPSGIATRQRTLEYLNQEFSRLNLTGGIRRELQSLREETDTQIFDSDLLHIGRRLEQQNNLEAAVLVFSVFNQRVSESSNQYLLPNVVPSLRERAQENVAVITGQGGSLGRRFEFQMNRFVEGATDPSMIAGMAIGSTVFTASRAMILPRLMNSSSRLLATVPFATRTTASALALVPEVGAFWGASKGIRELIAPGSTRWDMQTNLHEIAGLGITLGFLKSSGFAFGRLGAWARTPSGTPGFPTVIPEHPALYQQAGMLTGIMMGHGTEIALGLRPQQDGAFFLMDSLIMLAQFNAGGALSHAAFPRLYGFNNSLAQRMAIQEAAQIQGIWDAQIRSFHNLGDTLQGSGLEPGLAMAGNRGQGFGRPDLLRGPQILLMTGSEDGNGNSNGKIDVVRVEGDALGNAPTEDGMVPPKPETFDQTLEGPPANPVRSITPQEGFEDTVPPLRGPELAAQIARDTFPPSSNGFSPGERIGPDGKYEVIRHLGEGGMGAVYQVREVGGLHRNAVIKVNKDPRSTPRFVREYRIGANMTTSRKATVYELIEHNGITIPVMEFIPGRDVSHVIDGVRYQDADVLRVYPLEVRLEIFARICEAVAEIHRDGVLHRDLKPDNIRLTGWSAVLESRLRDAREEGRPPEEIQSIQELYEVEKDRPLDDVRIMDLGIATILHRLTTDENGTQSDSRKPSIMPPRLEEGNGVHTVEGAFLGTPGYIAPESLARESFPTKNLSSGDLFALGVILYELATGHHPFALYQPGGEGEPPLVVQRSDSGYTRMNLMGVMQLDNMQRVPSFEEVVLDPESFGPLFPEVEAVARRALLPQPKDRFGSIDELRQAVEILGARLKSRALEDMRLGMSIMMGNMEKSWQSFQPGDLLTAEAYEKLQAPIRYIKNEASNWREGGNELIASLSEGRKGRPWPEAQRIIADLRYQQLIEGGDRISPARRGILFKEIRENDVLTETVTQPILTSSIEGRAPVSLMGVDLLTGENISDQVSVRVIPLVKNRDSLNNETENFEEAGGPIFVGKIGDFRHGMRLSAGYYALEVSSPGYAKMRVPLSLSYEDVCNFYRGEGPFARDLDMVPSHLVPEGMTVIQGGRATLGWDYIEDGHPLDVYSTPKREIDYPTFLMARDPISNFQYREEFIQDLFRQESLREDDVKILVPRATEPVRKNSRMMSLLANATRVFRREPTNYWSVRFQKIEGGKRLVFTEPDNRLDHNGDPLDPNQPIAAIDYLAAQFYVKWRSERDGVQYRIPRIEELELVARGSLPFTYPWGYESDPTRIVTRSVFENKELSFPQPIGTHPLRGESGDKSLFGVRDLLGNVREFSSTQAGENDTIFIFGGNVRAPYGPYFIPANRTWFTTFSRADAYGAFRLALDLPAPKKGKNSE